VVRITDVILTTRLRQEAGGTVRNPLGGDTMNRRSILASLGLQIGMARFNWARAAEPPPNSMRMVPVGGHEISTRLYDEGITARRSVIVLIPGSGNESVLDSAYTQQTAAAFASRGIACLAYDKRGTGRSTGRFTGSDFAGLGEDAAAVARFAASLPRVDLVGLWGISQAGWVIPYAVRGGSRAALAILVSPAGVNPFEQVAYFLRVQAAAWGLSVADIEKADRMHRAVALYYAGRESYQRAQEQVDAYRGEPWFRKVVTHPYWDEMTPEGRIMDPDALALALEKRPGEFEIYRSASSFHDYTPDYADLRLPTLNVYGQSDALVPIDASRAVFESAWIRDRRHRHDFRVFEGANHDIETRDGVVLAAYLDLMASWARLRFDEA